MTTTFASALVLILSGFLLDRFVVDDVLRTKLNSAMTEAQSSFDLAQTAMSDSSITPETVDQKVWQVAKNVATRGNVSQQYEVFVDLRTAKFEPWGKVKTDPIPANLRAEVVKPQRYYWTYTSLDYISGKKEPALAIGAILEAQQGNSQYPFFFVFGLQKEVETIDSIRRGVIAIGMILLLSLGLVSYVVSRTIVHPVREAAKVAGQMAAGNLESQLPVRGTDDLAALGTSMNLMAQELQKQISSYEELSRMQQRFVSDVSHELRTPLTTVRMAIDLIYENRADYDEPTHRSAEILHDEIERFDTLLNDLLEISRFDAGAAVLVLDDYDLGEIVRTEIENQRPLADRMKTAINLQVGADLVASIDPRRIQRILRNLITNAIEHGEGQPIEVTVMGDANAVAVTVRDHGVGFHEHQATLVFHRFWRGDPARARSVGGTGLGLAISREDAQLHGGWLHAWGKPGQGAQFRLTLPRKRGYILTTSPLAIIPKDIQ